MTTQLICDGKKFDRFVYKSFLVTTVKESDWTCTFTVTFVLTWQYH